MITIEQAILAINPNASMIVRYNGQSDIDFEIEWTNNTSPILKENIFAKQAELQIIEDNKIQQQKLKKESAIAKLTALGLDEEEVKAIIGV